MVFFTTHLTKFKLIFLFIVFFPTAFASDLPVCCSANYELISSIAETRDAYSFPVDFVEKSSGELTLIPTFNSISVYWKPGLIDEGMSVHLRYRENGSDVWREGFPLWGDLRPQSAIHAQRENEYRGSILLLKPGTEYVVQAISDFGEYAENSIATWNNWPIIKETVNLDFEKGKTVVINRGGGTDGYVLYQSSNPIDGLNLIENGVVVKANYVVLNNLKVLNTKSHAVVVADGYSDIYINGSEISRWGSESNGFPVDLHSGIYISRNTKRIVVQNNRIINPNTSSNSWEEINSRGGKHPMGPQAISLFNSNGNNVIRNNYINAGRSRFFNDCIGGGDNFSVKGSPGPDSDIYGNYIQGCLDDAIETEGGNINVRVFLNFIDKSFVMFGASPTLFGPLYIFRNITYRSQRSSKYIDGRGSLLKLQNRKSKNGVWGGGRVFFFNNSALNNVFNEGVSRGIHGSGSLVLNLHAKNNIIDVGSRGVSVMNIVDSDSNSVDYNLFSGRVPGLLNYIKSDNCIVLNRESEAYLGGVYIKNFSLLPEIKSNVGALEEDCRIIKFDYRGIDND